MNKKRALHPRQKKVSGEVLLFLSYFSILERKIICATTLCCRSCRLNWRECCSCAISRSCWLSRSYRSTYRRKRTWLHSAHSTSYGVRVNTLDVPGTDAVEPTALILVSINIERNQEFLTTLNVELSQTVCSENIKAQFLWILLVGFNYERLSFPLSSLRDAASFRQNGNNLSL